VVYHGGDLVLAGGWMNADAANAWSTALRWILRTLQ